MVHSRKRVFWNSPLARGPPLGSEPVRNRWKAGVASRAMAAQNTNVKRVVACRHPEVRFVKTKIAVAVAGMRARFTGRIVILTEVSTINAPIPHLRERSEQSTTTAANNARQAADRASAMIWSDN